MSLLLVLLLVVILLAIVGGWWGNRAGWWGGGGRHQRRSVRVDTRYGVPFSNGSAPNAGPSGYVDGTTPDYVGRAVQGPNDVQGNIVPASGWNPMYFVIGIIVVIVFVVAVLLLTGFIGHIKQF